ncbi:aldo/keto reductase [Cellvibrio zantedeschiae]|uniref:Aldo/keto reductase n=1 Tax=Cellvibrio zantedeschiae TaxID=1237077 RepID=A0ABQ3APF8_9GAMM|nr:aldo/keto reductase [Cellvibrio zantedeschiae]GGY61302.1 aldo/keto reductase [Cellvibrio zantedeschiae]
MLPQTQLGNTDLRVSRLGLGTVKLGRNQSVKYPEAFELPSDDDARTLLSTARDLGINLLDTAPAYGVSEERLGYLLRGERKDWVICTKAGEEFSRNYDGNGNSNFDFEASALRLSVERSLRRLRTDYLDIVLIHSDGNDSHLIHHHQVLHTLSKLKQEGWIRAFGMSTKTLEGGMICAQEADVVMATFDPAQADDHKLMQSCALNNAGVLLKKIFNSGHLLAEDQTQKTANAIIEQQMKVIFAQSAVNSAIIGTLNCQHLRSNVECALLGLAENSKLA